MSERRGSRGRIVLEESSDEEGRQSTSSRRHNYYNTQRVGRSSRPGTGTSHATSSKSKGKSVSYSEPRDFDNLNETAVTPPVPSLKERSGLEDNIRQERSRTKSADRDQRTRRERNVASGQEGLDEVEVEPPVSRKQKRSGLEDRERGDQQPDEPPQPTRQKQPDEYLDQGKQPEKEVFRALTELYSISYLILFAIFGTLARLGTQWITFYPGTPVVTPVIWANFAGSLIFGFLAEDQALFRADSSQRASNGESDEKEKSLGEDKAAHLKRKKTIPLYIGLSTGFCGSYTSFSSFARDYFLGLANELPTPINHPHPGLTGLTPTSTVSRNGGYSFEAFLHIIVSTLALSIGGLLIGAQLAAFADPITPRLSRDFFRKYVDKAAVFLAFGCWLGAVLLAILPPDRPGGPSSRGSWSNETWRGEVLFAIVFAPLGCLLRFYASLKLNGLVPAFPLGTFACNMLGTAIEGMCYDIQHVGVGVMGQVGGGRVGCQVLQGVQDGFCGTLTTVSTWVGEINGLKRKHGWGYAFGSILGGLCLMLVIMGSVKWSVGYSTPVCNTGYTSKVHG